MQKFLILGGYGSTGKLLARLLLQHTQAEVVVAGRRLEKAEQLAAKLNQEFPGQRALGKCVDAASRESMASALPGIDMLVVASNTTQHAETVIQAALETGVDYLDIQLGKRKLELLQRKAGEIERSGRCFITEAGFHPGLPSAMIRYAAGNLEQIDSAVTAGFLNMGKDLPYTEAVDELMEAFLDYQAQVLKDGKWTSPRKYQMRTIDFGGEIGKRVCTSMFFEELRDLPGMLPTLREAGFYIAGIHWVNDWLITLIVMLGLKLAPQRGMRPMGKLMWWGMQTFHKPPYLVALKLEAQGKFGGKPRRVEGVISHPDGYMLTAVPVAACLLQWMDGTARRPGLWMMGHLVDPARLFADMERMGVRVEMQVREIPQA